MSEAANYTAVKTVVDSVEVIRLADSARRTEVFIAPSIGNNAYEMTVKGKRVFWSPYKSPAELKAKPAMSGNPFLAPWANRIDQDAYYANGKKYLLNRDLENFRSDGNRKPIHGLVVYAKEWEVSDLRADETGASVTSRLEFWRHPEWMAQFPFAHTIEMTYRLSEGALEVQTSVQNHSTQPMPLAIGYHPYFQVNDAPRDAWKVHLPVRDHMVLSKELIPTGERKPVVVADPQPLNGIQLDDVFSGLERDSRGLAEFWVQGDKEKVSVVYGPKYTVAVVYAPSGRGFICFEPMTGLTNAFNLAHHGTYDGLQSIPAGGTWKESFWVRTEGF